MNTPTFNWQQKGWPKATFDRAALRDELKAFAVAFGALKKCLEPAQDPELTAETLTDEAVTTSAIEGVRVDESAVMSSICRALGVSTPPMGFAKDARAEGVAAMMLAVRREWNVPVSDSLIRGWHKCLMSGDVGRIAVGAFRRNPVYVVRNHADGTQEVRFEAPPGGRVPGEIRKFASMWKAAAENPADVALKAAMLHPHFESIHPFEDGNGRVGRALVAKTIAEGLGVPLVLPVSTVIARHRAAYYDEINEASRSLDWTNWCAFFIPVLTEMLTGFVSAAKFIAAKRAYLGKYEKRFSERAKKVVLRMFEDGEKGIAAGLSAAKWMRMAKVSKPTATRDLAELAAIGAVIPIGAGAAARYALNGAFSREPIEGLNEGINESVLKLVGAHPGVKVHTATNDGSAGAKGFVTEPLDDRLVELSDRKERFELFTCGPDGLLKAVAQRATGSGAKGWISMDRHMICGVGACYACIQKTVRGNSRCCIEGPVFAAEDLVW